MEWGGGYWNESGNKEKWKSIQLTWEEGNIIFNPTRMSFSEIHGTSALIILYHHHLMQKYVVYQKCFGTMYRHDHV